MSGKTEQPDTRAPPPVLNFRWPHNISTRIGALTGIVAAVFASFPIIGDSTETSIRNTANVEGDNSGQVAAGDINNTTNNYVGDPQDSKIMAWQRQIIQKQLETIGNLLRQQPTDEQGSCPAITLPNRTFECGENGQSISQQILNAKEQVREEITDAIIGLSNLDSEPLLIKQAEAALANGNTELAQELYRTDADNKVKAGDAQLRAAADSFRRMGALAFSDDKAALGAYQKAVEAWPEDFDAWNQLGQIYVRMGDLDKSEEAYNTVLRLSESDKKWQAIAYGNIGNVYRIKGELDQAVEMHEKSLALNTELDRKEGMASNYGNLGTVYRIKGELDKAEVMYEKALAIDEGLNRKEGMASHYGNLGTVYRIGGELDQAVGMLEKSLVIEQELDNKIGMANDYGNLGIIYHMRDELDQAEAMYKKALTIDEVLDRKEGLASHYGNLGMIHEDRGELDQAEALYKKALVIDDATGRPSGMARHYGNLGNVYEKRGESSRAIESWEKAKALFDYLDSPFKIYVQKLIDDHKIELEIELELDEE